MPLTPTELWTDRLRESLQGYEEGLLRQVAGKLCKPRSHWPRQELVDRCVATFANPAVLDRRLQDLEPAGRALLALIGHSRQPRWHVGNLVEIALTLGQEDGLAPVRALFEAGMLYPETSSNGRPGSGLRAFDNWIAQGNTASLWAFVPPAVTERALGSELGLPDCPGAVSLDPSGHQGDAIHEADGLEWLLRLAVLWQMIDNAPLRRTQQRDFFKRDQERLRGDPLLSAAPADSLADVPDPGLLAVALALAEGLVREDDGELKAGVFPPAWADGLGPALASLWSSLLHLENWSADTGWQVADTPGNPFPSAYLVSLLLLSRLPDDGWAKPEEIARWVVEHHPFWKGSSRGRRDSLEGPRSGLVSFLLGLAYQMRIVQAARATRDTWVIRLSPLGRWLLGLGPMPAGLPTYPQTLLVQPNLEILVYRQGLTPELISRLGRVASWKSLGAACTLQFQPETVYRALESGETFESIVQTLERHSMKATPTPVLEALRTWSNKRERISVYPAAALFEFTSAADLQEALARGLPAVRVGDCLAVVANEGAIDYRHFRLTATRDYCLPLEKCVEVETDGVTLTIDLARSDLLLETELQRFAEPPQERDTSGKRRYRLTPESLAAGKKNGLGVHDLEAWFLQRAGQPLSPAARLLLTAADHSPPDLRRQLVLHVANPELADGLQQWPATRSLVHERLGPTTLAILEEHVETLKERLHLLGVAIQFPP